MKREELIEVLTNITFSCVDELDERDRYFIDLANKAPKKALKWLESHNKRWASTANSDLAMQLYKEKPNWDNFHSAAHFLKVNKIIHFLKTGEGRTMKECILGTVNCGVVEQKVVDSLLALVVEDKMAA